MTTSSIERSRTRDEAVEGLFVGLLRFGRSVRSRSGDWGHTVRDLNKADVIALGVVERGGRTRPGQIAARLGVDPSVVSRQLAPLHRLGVIERRTDPLDGRAELIGITSLGRDRLQQARAAMCAALSARLTEWDLETISRAATVVEDLAELLDQPVAPTDTEFTGSTTPTKDAHA